MTEKMRNDEYVSFSVIPKQRLFWAEGWDVNFRTTQAVVDLQL